MPPTEIGFATTKLFLETFGLTVIASERTEFLQCNFHVLAIVAGARQHPDGGLMRGIGWTLGTHNGNWQKAELQRSRTRSPAKGKWRSGSKMTIRACPFA